MQLNSNENNTKIFIFNNPENVMHAILKMAAAVSLLLSVCLGKISDAAWEKCISLGFPGESYAALGRIR